MATSVMSANHSSPLVQTFIGHGDILTTPSAVEMPEPPKEKPKKEPRKPVPQVAEIIPCKPLTLPMGRARQMATK